MLETLLAKCGIWAIEGLRVFAIYVPHILGTLTFFSILFFFLNGLWYRARLGLVQKKLQTIDAKAHREAIQRIFPTKRLRHLWSEYDETLHTQHDEQDGQRRVLAIRSTIPAETYFNDQYVVDSYLRTEFFKHLPGIFTGLGIIGTFGGIIEGLGQFQVSENAVTVRQSLESLMHSVGHAFLISGCAIALAMIFTILEKSLLASLYRKTEDISHTIDSHFESGAGEEYLSRLVDASEASASQAKILKDALVNDLKQVLQEITQYQVDEVRNLHDQQLAASREGNQTLGEVISTSIEKSLKAPLDEIAASVKSASGDQSKAAIDMLNDVMVHFSQRLNDLFGGQINGINELNKQTAQSMQDAVASLNTLLGKLEDSGKRATDEMATKMASSIQAMEERQASINAQTQEFVDQIRKLVESSQAETQQKLQGTLETIGQQMTSILGTLSTSQAQVFAENQAREKAMADRASSAVNQMSSRVEAAIQEISGASQAMAQSVAALSSATTSSIDKMNANIESVSPRNPGNSNPNFSLLPHQQQGLAWLQHLYKSRMEYKVRGAVLADDMGLGKTFQLLSLMAWHVEQDPNVHPMLVVAPVSLLENWAEEAEKFIRPNVLPILTAYGDSLANLRVSRKDIEERLQAEDGLVRFLKPGWTGSAKVVLTTYETLRDLEFSFAAEHWSLMVCDEAQRIKNPAAMVTRAAKKQNVDFKIACTGTPVENTLADLWCLFDFVQPGLLGALNDFGDRYRKPIEAKDEEERARVEELRTRISPQILRRTKAEVAKDLPKKIIVEDCQKLPLSSEQRKLYASAIESFKTRKNPDSVSPFKNTLGLLHYLRLICTDPRRYGLTASNPEPLKQYQDKSPKLNWLLDQLATIKDNGEKAIIFCEFRNIQRLLRHYIEEQFKVSPPIINGDTNATTGHADSRQHQIRKFQEAPGFGVIILSPVAVGFGVNIQAANHVIHYTRTWNPAKEDQATDRAYRIGQKKDVYVYYPVVRADDFSTFDVKLDQLLTRKRELAGDMLNGSGDVRPGDFNVDEVVPDSYKEAFNERIALNHALSMEPRLFEGLVAILWSKQGYQCYCTPQSRDQGVDVVATCAGDGLLIQAKTSSTDGKKLGWDAVKEVVAGAAFYQRKHQNIAFQKVCITNQFFNSQAHEQAVFNNVRLIDQTELADLLQRHPVTMLELDQMLYAEWGTSFDAI